MIPEIRALYGAASTQTDMARWLGDKDMIQDYKDTMRFLSKDADHLLSVLSGQDREMFQRYMENRACQLDLECQMQFAMGFAMGLRTGALCIERTI